MSERYWECWDEDRPEYYAKTYGPPDNPVEEHLNRMRIARSLIEGDSVLDVGCGIGHLYHQLPSNMFYVGVDTSPYMVEYAKQYGDGDFCIGDAYDLTEFDCYDSVVCQSVLIHLPEIETAIRELWKHVGKALIFSIPVSSMKKVNVWREYKDKKILSHTDTLKNITALIVNLDGFMKYEAVVEPSKINNTYFKVWRKQR